MQSASHHDPSDSAHYADQARRATRIWRLTRAWYFFPLHAIIVIVFTVVALAVLDGKTFPTSSDAPFGTTITHIFTGQLRQADVTTLVSAALVLVRLTLNVCSSIAAQRSIFILLEKCGITLQEIERIFSFEQGPLGMNGFKLGTVILLLLLIPAQLSAPLAQGALSWEPQLSLRHADYNVSLNIAGPGDAFNEFKAHDEPRDFSIKRASGLAVIHRFGPDFYSVVDSDKKVPSRRWAPAFREHELSNQTKGYQALPGNTSIGNTTLPFFRMSNLTWIDYDDSLEHFLAYDNGLFNVTSPMNPLRASLPGNAVILRDSPIHTIVTGNATYAPTWANLPGFLAGAFSAAYQASWNDLTDRLALPPDTHSATSNISLPHYPLRAAVDAPRVRTWLALHSLVLAAGALLALLQARCRHPPVVDFAAACLLTDPQPVVRAADAAAVRTAARVSARNSARVGALVVREEGGGALRFRVLKRKRDGEVVGDNKFGEWGGGWGVVWFFPGVCAVRREAT
ncbi:hypothetical protein UCDDS831_g01343 [Diplodia seriata]|uniref:Uncharacterized protein n=1 Tax=Diplodia seriata TaxID=420778 RepID=A0A0G2GTU3_9PEZI|nr:hypothetical protein UCDDS831_g01343 [Diplodia seriata]